MTRQESFNHICRNLIAATRPSMMLIENSSPLCQYRGDEAKCAVGWLIPDEWYEREMEAKPVLRLFKYYPDLKNLPAFQPWTPAQLEELQGFHDNAAMAWEPGTNWGDTIRAALADFAHVNGLAMEV